ncbi:MAG: TolC family protein [Myxococcales bacterium]|nr:TolC family protein [Myxococcales bacterium]
MTRARTMVALGAVVALAIAPSARADDPTTAAHDGDPTAAGAAGDPTTAGAARRLTLADALAVARTDNPALRGQQVAVARAEATARAARGVDDLIVEGGVEGTARTSPAIAGAAFQDTATRAVAARASVWQPLPWGGRVGVQVADDVARVTSRVAIGGPAVDITTTAHRPRVELIWLQPLARGRGRAVHDRPRHQAELTAAVERAGVTARGAQLGLDVATAYWELAYAAHEVALREHALVVARDQLAVTRARTDVGRGSDLEVLAVEQALAAREVARLAAVQARTARAVDLAVLLAVDPATPLVAADPLVDPAPAPPPALDATLAAALSFAPELRAVEHQTELAATELAAADGDRGPAIDLTVRGGPAGSSDRAGAAWSQVAQLDGYEVSAGLAFALPVGDRAARGRVAAARHERSRLELERADRRAHLGAAVRRAVDALVLSDQRIAAAALAADLAERTVALERDRWRTGLGTNFDVLTRQDQAVAAAAALARAHADRRIAAAAVAALTGAPR